MGQGSVCLMCPSLNQPLPLTTIPSLVLRILHAADPVLVPGVSEVDEENQLDDDEYEGSDHADVHEDWIIGENKFQFKRVYLNS